MVIAGELTEGHARALLGARRRTRDRGARREGASAGKLSVRATEALVRARAKKKRGERRRRTTRRGKSASVRDLEARLTRALGTKVEVRDRGNKGEIAIPYADLDALDRLIDKLL